VYCGGDNSQNQLGSTLGAQSTPKLVSF
jgi:hypothetical protein